MPRLSAALIVRDEAEHLGACLATVRDIVDEIVVVDTGSRDSSADIARQHGARVFFDAWRDDFARARNVALDHARGDWILYIDADERVECSGSLEPVLADANAVAATVGFQATSKLTPYPEMRLFRRRPEIRFRGVIHETIRYDVEDAVARGESVGTAPLFIRHLGYDGDRAWKFERDLPLLERAVAERPERIYLWHALGEALIGLGRAHEAELALRQGLEVVRREPPRSIHVLIYSDLLTLHFTGAQALDDCSSLVTECTGRHPDDPLSVWFMAQQFAQQDRRAEARALLAQLQTMEPTEPQGKPVGYDRRLFRGFAWGLMGSCWLADGDAVQALEWLQRAEEDCPDNLELRTKRQLAQNLVNGGSQGPLAAG